MRSVPQKEEKPIRCLPFLRPLQVQSCGAKDRLAQAEKEWRRLEAERVALQKRGSALADEMTALRAEQAELEGWRARLYDQEQEHKRKLEEERQQAESTVRELLESSRSAAQKERQSVELLRDQLRKDRDDLAVERAQLEKRQRV